MRNSRQLQDLLLGLGIDTFGLNPEAQESLGYEYTLGDIERSIVRRQGTEAIIWAPTQVQAGQRGSISVFSGNLGLWLTHCYNPTHACAILVTRLAANAVINTPATTNFTITCFENDAGQAYVDNVNSITPWSEFGVTIASGTTAGAFTTAFAVGLIPINVANPVWIPPSCYFTCRSNTANAASEFHLRLRAPFAGRRYSTNFGGGASEVEFY